MRNLVTVRNIDEINPIPNADAIECATVDGWKVVIKKGEFQVGDPCVYFEIDSFLPAEDVRFSFLAKNKVNWNERIGIRLRTVKLRGQISQGLVLPLSSFPEIAGAKVDIDCAEVLNVIKWEPPEYGSNGPNRIRMNPFPSFISKTDQERIQNLKSWLVDYADSEFEVTLKLDGSSMTVFHNHGEYGVASRNCTIEEFDEDGSPTKNRMWLLAKKDNLILALDVYGKNIALQGEFFGEGIQGNPEKITGQEYRVFDVFDIDTYTRLAPQARYKVIQDLRDLGAVIQEIPVLGTGKLAAFEGSVAKILEYAEGPSLNPDVPREGVVFKAMDGSVSFKVISNSYLLKNTDR